MADDKGRRVTKQMIRNAKERAAALTTAGDKGNAELAQGHADYLIRTLTPPTG